MLGFAAGLFACASVDYRAGSLDPEETGERNGNNGGNDGDNGTNNNGAEGLTGSVSYDYVASGSYYDDECHTNITYTGTEFSGNCPNCEFAYKLNPTGLDACDAGIFWYTEVLYETYADTSYLAFAPTFEYGYYSYAYTLTDVFLVGAVYNGYNDGNPYWWPAFYEGGWYDHNWNGTDLTWSLNYDYQGTYEDYYGQAYDYQFTLVVDGRITVNQ